MRYRAFISYSHADEASARWLFKRLETYRVPPRLVGHAGTDGPIQARLGAFFRDRDELTASSDLSGTIRAALADSAALIVICSPAAAASRWVNAEIAAFRASGRGAQIYAFVVAGEPGSGADAGGCFPEALLVPGADGQPTEPLAADARKAGDGRERALLKLVAGLLGISFDALAQREAQRRQRKLALVTTASLAGMAIAIGLAVTAVVARNDAQRRQAQAEDILGFMLGDLREKLSKVGRLDVMRAVDDKATDYFASIDPRDMTDRALEEQARSLTGIGQVRLQEGNHSEAMTAFREAHARSTALYERAPDNGQRLFDLAQAEYWIGYVAWQQGRLDDAGAWLTRYRDSAIKLAAMDRNNFDWQREVAYGHHNLAVLDDSLGRYAEAETAMREELALYRQWTQEHPDDTNVRFEAANVASWLGSLMLRQGRLREAESFFAEQLDGYRRNVEAEPYNFQRKFDNVEALSLLAEAQASLGKIPNAQASADAACTIATALTEQDPANNDWRATHGICRLWQAKLAGPEQWEFALSSANDATTLLSAAHKAEPQNERILRWLVRTHLLQAQLSLEQNQASAAEQHVSMAFALIEPAWGAEQSERVRPWLAGTRLLQGDVAHERGDAAAAVQAWSDAKQLLLEGGEPIPFPRLEPLVRALIALDQQVEATQYRQRLDAVAYVPLQPWPAQGASATR